MNEPVTPEQKQRLIAGYVLCDLSPEESLLLQNLLAEEPALEIEIETMQGILDRIYLPEVEPPSHLRERVMQSFSKDSGALSSPQPQLSAIALCKNLFKKPWRQRVLGTVAAGLIVGLSISNYVLWRSLQVQTRAIAQLQFVLESTASNDQASAATAQVKVDPEQLQGTLVVENLPPLAEDEVYVLWTVVEPNTPVTTDDKNAILTEVFTLGDQSRSEIELVMPKVFRELNSVQAVAITIENREAPQSHQAAPILIGAVEVEI